MARKETRFLLVRHGETSHNQDGIVQGQTDTALSEHGVAQAEDLAERLAAEPIAAIYTSNLRRSKRTAEIIGRSHAVAPTSMSDLAEQHVGDWQGRNTASLFKMLDEEGHTWVEWKPANGERWGEFCDRVLSAIETIRERHLSETVLVVGHAEVNKATLSQAMYADTTHKDELTQENACLNEFRWHDDGGWRVETVNDVKHLS